MPRPQRITKRGVEGRDPDPGVDPESGLPAPEPIPEAPIVEEPIVGPPPVEPPPVEPPVVPPEPEPEVETGGGDLPPVAPGPGPGPEQGPPPFAVPERPPGEDVAAPVTGGETFALPGERGFTPFQGRFFGRDLGSLLERRGNAGFQGMMKEAQQRGDLSRSLSSGLLGSGGGGGGIGGTLGAQLPREEDTDFLRLVGNYGG